MRILLAALLLTGCATTAQPAAEWRQMPNGAWVGPATTYQKGSEPGRDICADPRYLWACSSFDAYRRAVEDYSRAIR